MMMTIFFLQENAISTNAGHFSEGEKVVKQRTKIFWPKPVFKMESEHKLSIHVIRLCAASAIARAFLGYAANQIVSFFQGFFSHWISEHILIVIILNENDTTLGTAFFIFFFLPFWHPPALFLQILAVGLYRSTDQN